MSHLGHTEEAIPLIEKSIELDPFNPVNRKMLVVRLIETKQYPRADEDCEDYLEIFLRTISCGRCLPAQKGRARNLDV